MAQGEALTAEAVAAKWDEITDTTTQTAFKAGNEHGANMFARISEAKGA